MLLQRLQALDVLEILGSPRGSLHLDQVGQPDEGAEEPRRKLEPHCAGMSTLECLRACTSTAAKLLGRGDRGRLAPGLRADVIAMEGDPRESIDVLERVTHVFSGGVAVGEPPSPWKIAAAIVVGMAGTVRDGALGSWDA